MTASDLTCRICFEDASNAAQLIAPCGCTGSQKYVHLHCLRLWQENVLSSVPFHLRHSHGHDSRASVCNVCRRPYAFPPPPPTWRQLGTRMGHLLAASPMGPIGLLLGMFLAAPGTLFPWLMLCLMVFIVFCGYRLVAALVMAALATLFLLHLQGLRVTIHPLEAGWGLSYGMVFIRHGASVPGLGAGTLIKAPDGIQSQAFTEAVILLVEHSAVGATGVCLGRRMHAIPDESSGIPPSTNLSVKHFHGGPVGAQGGWAAVNPVHLHNVEGVEGAELLLPSISLAHPAVYMGGSRASIVGAAAASSSSPHPPQPQPLSRVPNGGQQAGGSQTAGKFLYVYQGIAAWAAGQLEGELRAGNWEVGKALASDLSDVNSHELWHKMSEQRERFSRVVP
ncbi:hypothetical protein WJX84_003814 [Apatococcus fuscideae]|uniref:RING-CH-type domain-containing protein n=1 Tax=Apatococcus fuscideae TaxID=2026836 RepID=A0AAW1RJU8_9CHLO